jgi:hypothetical protein
MIITPDTNRLSIHMPATPPSILIEYIAAIMRVLEFDGNNSLALRPAQEAAGEAKKNNAPMYSESYLTVKCAKLRHIRNIPDAQTKLLRILQRK